MTVKSLHVLRLGSQPTDKGLTITYRVDLGKICDTPVTAYLIKTDEGNMLFDAGLGPEAVKRRRAQGRTVNITEKDLLPQRLAEIGVSAKDISTVFLSHLHYDHTGYLKDFRHAEIIVQRAEYAFAFNTPSFSKEVYLRSDFDIPGLKWRLIEGDEFLAPGLTAINTMGHSPGHQSLLVNLPKSGNIILTGDCAFCRENIEKELIPLYFDPEQTLYAIKRLKMLARLLNAQLVFNHDIEWQTVKKPLEYY